MLRHHSCIIAFAAMLVALSPAQAEDTVLTLACQGTATFPTKENPKVLPISTGIVVTNCTGDHVLRVNGTVICCEGRVKSSALGVWIICS